MGKLADRLKQVTERPVRAMGFRAAAAQAKQPGLLLLATLDGASPEAVTAALAQGADGVLVPGAGAGPGTGGLWGAVLQTGGKADVEQAKEAGAAFVLFRSTQVAGDGLQVEGLDFVLEVEQGWPDMLLRAVDRLPVAAALYRLDGGGVLSVEGLLQCRRVVGLVGKPVIAEIPSGAGTGVLSLLRDAGITGVAVAASEVPAFQEAIRDLPPPKREKEHMEATLPAAGGRAAAHEEEDDDDDEDGD